MANNKLKLGDRVRLPDDVREGIVVNIYSKKTGQLAVQFSLEPSDWSAFYPDDLTLIDSGTPMSPTPEETANVLDDSVTNNNYEGFTMQQFANGMRQYGEIMNNSNPIENDGIKKGFNPEKLEFDGREIKAGDSISFNKNFVECNVIEYNDGLYAKFNSYRFPLVGVNVVAHFPAKSELEEVDEELQKAKLEIATKPRGFTVTDEQFDRYYQARKKLENLNDK